MITDEMITNAATELATAIYESSIDLGTYRHSFSPRFEKKMRHLIRKSNNLVINRVLRGVAGIVLIIFIFFGSFLAINSEAREIVFDWVKQQYQGFYKYFFVDEVIPPEGIVPTEPVDYQPEWMPEGCVFVTAYDITDGKVYIYTNEQESLIQFAYTSDTDTTKLFVDGVTYDKATVLVNELPGEIYLATNLHETNIIIWINADTHTLFWISGNFASDDLLKIAESVKEIVH